MPTSCSTPPIAVVARLSSTGAFHAEEGANFIDKTLRLIAQLSQSSRVMKSLSDFQKLDLELTNLRSLRDNWDSYDAPAPTTIATSAARKILGSLERERLLPASLVPSSEGGVAFYFFNGDRTAYIESRNSAEIIAAMYDRESEPVVVELSQEKEEIDAVAKTLATYIANSENLI